MCVFLRDAVERLALQRTLLLLCCTLSHLSCLLANCHTSSLEMQADTSAARGYVSVEDGEFSWSEDKTSRAVLSGVNFEAQPGTLTMASVGRCGEGLLPETHVCIVCCEGVISCH